MAEKFDCGYLISEGEISLDFTRPFSDNIKRLNEVSTHAIINAINYFKNDNPQNLKQLDDEFPKIMRFNLLWARERLKSIITRKGD